jgi:hypothetical protein
MPGACRRGRRIIAFTSPALYRHAIRIRVAEQLLLGGRMGMRIPGASVVGAEGSRDRVDDAYRQHARPMDGAIAVTREDTEASTQEV